MRGQYSPSPNKTKKTLLQKIGDSLKFYITKNMYKPFLISFGYDLNTWIRYQNLHDIHIADIIWYSVYYDNLSCDLIYLHPHNDGTTFYGKVLT